MPRPTRRKFVQCTLAASTVPALVPTISTTAEASAHGLTPKLKPYQALQKYWSATGTNAISSPESAVAGLEVKYAVQLPHDFREYLLLASPANPSELIANDDSWWGIDANDKYVRIKSLIDDCGVSFPRDSLIGDASKYLIFADHLIWCWAWAINCGTDETRGQVVLITDPNRVVAASFAQFVELYTSDWELVI
jgi:hypothetical protein